MDRVEALLALQQDDPERRLEAARSLAHSAIRDDAPAIRAAIEGEGDRWTRHHLLRALRFSVDRRTNRRRLALITSQEQQDQIFGVAVGAVTRLLLHEVNAILGDIRRYAERELADGYQDSKTRRSVERLDRLTSAIAELNRAASPAKIAEFDLATTVDSLADACATRAEHAVDVTGRRPALVRSDEALVELAVDQAIRNAIEANRAAGSSDPILVSWDVDPDHFSVTVLDRGVGLPRGFDRSLRTIRTTKDKKTHQGLGLMTASRAAKSVGGSIQVTPRAEGGTAFSFAAPIGRVEE